MAQQIFDSSTKLSESNDFGQQRHAAGLVTVAPKKKNGALEYICIFYATNNFSDVTVFICQIKANTPNW